MAPLLRADLRRLARPHGSFLFYLAIFLAFVLLTVVGAPLVVSAFSGLNQGTEAAAPAFTGYASSLNLFTGLLAMGWVSLMTSWCAASVCWADMRGGFDRTMIGSCGKKAYYSEKLLLALVLSCAFLVAGMVVSLVAGFVMGLESLSSPVSVLLWFVLVALECWGCAALTLAVLWVSKSNTLAFGVGLTLAMGIVSGILNMSLGPIPGVNEVWSEVSSWLPNAAFALLQSVDNGELALELIDVAHILVPAAVCVGVAYVVANNVLPKRDM